MSPLARLARALGAAGALCLAAGVAGACQLGQDPPAPTGLINIQGGSFTLGSSELKCGGAQAPEMERCDSGKLTDPLYWIADLTWVPEALVVALPDFQIEEHEVTNLQYRYCVESGSCTPPAYTTVDDREYYADPDFADAPVVWVSQEQAEAYCAFVGRRLPSEAQWERAARLGQGGEMRTYPYAGSEVSSCTGGSARYIVAQGCARTPLPVGHASADATYYGVRDMASNVAEWVRDAWHTYARCEGLKGYAQSCQLQGTACPACQSDGAACAASCLPTKLVICKAGTYSVYTGSQLEKVVRGGSYLHSRCFHRLFVRHKSTVPGPEIGFRCVLEASK